MNDKILNKNEWNAANCPIRSVLDRIGDKWSILVLLTLGEKNTLRFNELNKEIGPDISQKMLTVTLRSLEADGYVKRTVFPLLKESKSCYSFLQVMYNCVHSNMKTL
jgi:DNA-binding HxlR family transcriptional regulator